MGGTEFPLRQSEACWASAVKSRCGLNYADYCRDSKPKSRSRIQPLKTQNTQKDTFEVRARSHTLEDGRPPA